MTTPRQGRDPSLDPQAGPADRASVDRSSVNPGDRAALRDALGRFATGVTVITARGFDGAPAGFTANSFNSVSLDPPLILWSLARSSPSLGTYRAAEHYAVNILSASQAGLAARFARRDVDRFEGVDWREGIGGAPVLDGALAVFECAHEAVYPAGDHELFIGRVMGCAMGGGAPLTFFAGRFGSVQEEEAKAPPPGPVSPKADPADTPDPAALGAALQDAAGRAADPAALQGLSGTEAADLSRLLARIGG